METVDLEPRRIKTYLDRGVGRAAFAPDGYNKRFRVHRTEALRADVLELREWVHRPELCNPAKGTWVPMNALVLDPEMAVPLIGALIEFARDTGQEDDLIAVLRKRGILTENTASEESDGS